MGGLATGDFPHLLKDPRWERRSSHESKRSGEDGVRRKRKNERASIRRKRRRPRPVERGRGLLKRRGRPPRPIHETVGSTMRKGGHPANLKEKEDEKEERSFLGGSDLGEGRGLSFRRGVNSVAGGKKKKSSRGKSAGKR